MNRWSLRIADRVGWNAGQDLPPEGCAWDVQMMREQSHGEPSSVEKTIKLKMKRDKDKGTEGYLSLVKRATFKDLFYFLLCVCVWVCTCKFKCPRGQRHKISWSGITGSWELPNIEL